jgi:dGTPase
MGSSREAERNRFLNYVSRKKHLIGPLSRLRDEEIDEIFGNLLLLHFSLNKAYEGTRDDRARLRSFTSILVGRYINGLQLRDPSDGDGTVTIDPGYESEIAILKQLTWCYVIEAPALAVQQHAQKQVVKTLFSVFMNETKKDPSLLLPAYYRERLTLIKRNQTDHVAPTKRMVVDLIAGMTESQALSLYQRLHGITPASAMDKVLV